MSDKPNNSTTLSLVDMGLSNATQVQSSSIIGKLPRAQYINTCTFLFQIKAVMLKYLLDLGNELLICDIHL